MLYVLALASGLTQIISIIRGENGLYPLLLFAFPFIFYPVNILFLKKTRSLRSIVLLNIGFFTACMLVTIFFANIENNLEYFFIVIFYAAFAFLVPSTIMNKPPKKAYLAVLDVNILIILIAFALKQNIVYIAAIFMISLFSVYTYDEKADFNLKDAVKIIVFLLSSIGLMALFIRYIAKDAGKALAYIWNKVTGIMIAIAYKLWQFILFVFSLFPEVEPGEMTPYSPTNFIYNIEEAEKAGRNIYVEIALIIISIFIAVYLIIKLFQYLGKVKINKTKDFDKKETVKRKRPSLLNSIKKLFHNIAKIIKNRIKLFKMRKTMVGKFYITILKNKVTPNHKRVGETPREYLQRIKDDSLSIQEIEEYLYK